MRSLDSVPIAANMSAKRIVRSLSLHLGIGSFYISMIIEILKLSTGIFGGAQQIRARGGEVRELPREGSHSRMSPQLLQSLRVVFTPHAACGAS